LSRRAWLGRRAPPIPGGETSGSAFASQSRVKLGMIRPPTSEISISSDRPKAIIELDVSASPSASRWASGLPTSSSDGAASIGSWPARSKNLPHDNRGKRGRETEIGDGGSGRADSGGEPNTNPPDRPKQDKCRQRLALQRHAAGPVRDRGQPKTGDGRRGKSEDHFMSVPDERRKPSRQNEPLGIGAKSERDRYGGPDRRRVGNRRRRSRRLYARDFAERRSWFETKRAFLDGRRARRPTAMNIYLVCIFWPASARWALRLLLDVRSASPFQSLSAQSAILGSRSTSPVSSPSRGPLARR
jgi:hypothetical protein